MAVVFRFVVPGNPQKEVAMDKKLFRDTSIFIDSREPLPID